MKRNISILLTTILLLSTMLLPASASNQSAAVLPNGARDLSVTMAINNDIIISNGVQSTITPPVLAFNKTYVAVESVAPFLGISTQNSGDSLIATYSGKSLTFTSITHWDDLNNANRFFVKDDKAFVSLRELADLCNYEITYNAGLINIRNSKAVYDSIYGSISTMGIDDFVYSAYPPKAEYVVYPYQAYSYETMLVDAEKLKNMYPDLIKTSSIGKSVENRDLLLIEFGRGDKKVFVCGTHHAREYIATTYLMYAIDRYAYAYRNSDMWGVYNPRDILNDITFCIVPMVNPDGVNLVQNGINSTEHAAEIANMKIYEGAKYGYSAWKANVRGVDVNWNYDRDWSEKRNKNARGSTGFNGDYAGSEPETLAVTQYVDTHSFEAYLSFHTQGQLFYWADSTENPLNLQQAIKRDTGFTGSKESGTGVGGSFFDYVYRNFNKPTITVELCPYVGNYPYPDKKFDTVWKPAKNILLVVGNEIIYKSKLK